MTPASPSASYPTIEESENGLLQGKSNTEPHAGGFHDETEGNELLGKSDTGLPVGGLQEHEAEEHETIERPVLSCRTQTINDLSPSTPEGTQGQFCNKSSCSKYVFIILISVAYWLCLLLIQDHLCLLHLWLGHQLKLRSNRVPKKENGIITVRRIMCQQRKN
jgi:hypothetical protein